MSNENEERLINNMINILKRKMEKEYPLGATKRDAHPKHLGLLRAYFSVSDDLPKEFQVGVFKEPKTYSAFIRISNASGKVEGDEKKDLRGFAIKLLEVQGEKYSEDEKFTQDFLLINYPTMPLGTVGLFHDAIYYSIKYNPIVFIFKMVLRGQINKLKELNSAKKNDTSPFDIRYWSTTPYKFGEEVVKYSIIPRSKFKSKLPESLTSSYLTENMEKHLQNEEALFDFMIQLQKGNNSMPVEDAAIEWNEKDSPFIKVAEIRIPKQHIKNDKRDELAENLSFSPAHSLVEHKPIGGINRARVKIYKELSEFRHERNNKPLFEPTEEDFIKCT